MNTNSYVSRVIHPLIYPCVQLLCRPMMSYPRNQIVYYVGWRCVLFSIKILLCIGCANGNTSTKNNHTTHVKHTKYMKPWQMKQTCLLSNAMFYIRNTVVWTPPWIVFIWECVHVKTVTMFFSAYDLCLHMNTMIYPCVQLFCRPMLLYPRNQIVSYFWWRSFSTVLYIYFVHLVV